GQDVPGTPGQRASPHGGAGLRRGAVPRRPVPLHLRHAAVPGLHAAAGAPRRGPRPDRRPGRAAGLPQLRHGPGHARPRPGRRRMSFRKFGRIVRDVMATLPEEFRPYLDNVVVDVEEEPDEPTLRKAGLTDAEIADGETLLGLFDPLELPGLAGGDFVDTDD